MTRADLDRLLGLFGELGLRPVAELPEEMKAPAVGDGWTKIVSSDHAPFEKLPGEFMASAVCRMIHEMNRKRDGNRGTEVAGVSWSAKPASEDFYQARGRSKSYWLHEFSYFIR